MRTSMSSDQRPRRRFLGRSLRIAALTLSVVLLVAVPAVTAGAKNAAKPKSGTKTSAASTEVLARLKIMGPVVSVKAAGKKKFVTAKDDQVLRQGDSIKTDAAGTAQINYTDGSLTRLGTSTKYTLTTLTNKKGARQTKGTLSVGQTWSRAAAVAQTGSFEVSAGGATAAVEGTSFAYTCQKGEQPGQLICEVTVVEHNVKVTGANGEITQLTPATTVPLSNGDPGDKVDLTYEDLVSNPFIAANEVLDFFTGKGAGFDEFPPPTTTTTTTQPPRIQTVPTLPPTTTLPPPTTTLPPPTTTIPPTTTTVCHANSC
jgi:hypothetical protein